MIQAIHVINHLGEKLTMELAHPERSGFVIFNISGLGPGKAIVSITDLVADDGGVFRFARLPPRNIVFDLRYFSWDNKSIEEIRRDSYKSFPIKSRITLIVETDQREATFEGYVESNEPNIFSKESSTQISMLCPNPFIVGKEQSVIFARVLPAFEFPFSNESLIEPLLIMSELLFDVQGDIIYDGNTDTGIIIKIEARGEVENLILYNLTANEQLLINTNKLRQITGFGILQGDIITINTLKGQKSIRLTRYGETINILNVLDRWAPWFALTRGKNTFTFRAESGETNVVMTILYRQLYEGV